MKMAFYEIEEWEIPHLEKSLQGHELTFSTQPLSKEDLPKLKDIAILSVFIYSPLPAEMLEQLPNLKLVTTRSTGFDHIDVAYCKKKGITVCSVPNYGADTVAEHTFALLLALAKNIVPSVERTRRGNFDLTGLRGFDLRDKTLGVVGLGHIGTEVIKIAKGFGMHVVCYTAHPNEEIARKLRITFLNLPELLRTADIVTLHLPYSKKTHHIINKKNIKRFKKGAVLINTARGGLIETEAIEYGLEQNILRSVGLDVLEEEYGIKEERQLLSGSFLKEYDLRTQLLNHVLLDRENVLVTPHNAFNSQEALQNILEITTQNILGFLHNAPVNTI